MAATIDHELKTHPGVFDETWLGRKKHEIRSTTDRVFQLGDAVLLREWDPESDTYTGREIYTQITSLTEGGGWGLPSGLVVFTHRELARRASREWP